MQRRKYPKGPSPSVISVRKILTRKQAISHYKDHFQNYKLNVITLILHKHHELTDNGWK